MPRLEFLVAAEGHSVDQQNNHLSIFNILERVTGAGFGIVAKLDVISVFARDAGDEGQDFQALLRVSTRNGQIGNEFPMNFRMEAPRHRLFHVIYGLPLEANAEYIRFDVTLNGREIGSYRVEVAEQEP